MDLKKIISELEAEKDKIEAAIKRLYKLKYGRTHTRQIRENILKLLESNKSTGLQTLEICKRLNLRYNEVIFQLTTLEARKKILRADTKKRGGYTWKIY